MKTILVVDDEVDIANTLQSYLELVGYRVMVAHDGREALEKVIEHKPNLVVTDIMMPRLDGNELIERIRATPSVRSVPIITMSARDGVAREPFFRKPFNPARLAEAIADLLEGEAGARPRH